MNRRLARLVIVFAVAVSLTMNVVSPMQPAAGEAVQCVSIPSGDKPVVFVHGLGSNDETWNPMLREVDELDGVLTDTFDYKSANDRWVTNPKISQALIDRIDCLSRASLKTHGSGKVDLVAHSMGGLAARLAASKVASKIGLVITIATPHQGSIYGNLGDGVVTSICKAPAAMISPGLSAFVDSRTCFGDLAVRGLSIGSEELRKLPSFPESVSVKAIAGDVTVYSWTPWGDNVIPTKGDLVVSLPSATNEYTTHGNGDGKMVFGCDARNAIATLTTAWCEHSNMLDSKQVQVAVKRGIEQHLEAEAEKKVSATGKPVAFRGLTLHVGPQWKETDRSDFAVSLERCSSEGCTKLTLYNERPTTAEQLIGYFRDCGAPVIEKGRSQVGGREAIYFEGEDCGPNLDKANRIWLVPGAMTVVAESSSLNTRNGVDELLARATW